MTCSRSLTDFGTRHGARHRRQLCLLHYLHRHLRYRLGTNIGARLQTEQAWADTQVALAKSEARRVEAIAFLQEMKAKQKEAQAALILAEALLPGPLADAFRMDNSMPGQRQPNP